MSIDLDGDLDSLEDNAEYQNGVIHETFEHPLKQQLFDLQNDESIDSAIQRVAISTIVYGKTVQTANEIARLCFAYQDENYVHQVEKHIKILKTHAAGRPGARMENNQTLVEVRTKMALVEAQYHLSKEESDLGMVPN